MFQNIHKNVRGVDITRRGHLRLDLGFRSGPIRYENWQQVILTREGDCSVVWEEKDASDPR